MWAIALVRSHVHKPLEGKDVALVPIADLVRLYSTPLVPDLSCGCTTQLCSAQLVLPQLWR